MPRPPAWVERKVCLRESRCGTGVIGQTLKGVNSPLTRREGKLASSVGASIHRVPCPQPKGKLDARSTVNFATMLDPDNDDNQPIILELADDSIVTNTKPAEPSKIAKERLGKTPRIRMRLQSYKDKLGNPVAVRRAELFDVRNRRIGNLNRPTRAFGRLRRGCRYACFS